MSAALLLTAVGFASAQIPITVSGSVPAAVDNSATQFFPGIGNQGAREACANAAGIGYVFTYEMNVVRNANGTASENRYPFFYTYDFLNDGSEKLGTFRMFLDAWNIARENGIANFVDFGSDDLSSTRWVSGYDRYFRIMQNRVDIIDSLEITDTGSLRKMKQWLFDHGNGAPCGGFFLFTAYIYGYQEDRIPSGAEAGKSIIKSWGTSHDSTSLHAMTIVGYNDSVRFDFNSDNKFTNTVDISDHQGKIGAKDGTVDMADWEIGAFRVVNSWGASWGDNGYAYAPYRSLIISYLNGGIISDHRLYFIRVKKDYTPKMALKASITRMVRNTIALSVGVSPDPQATAPSKIRSYERQFRYAGGAFPMCGSGASGSIEIGLDISDLLDSINGSRSAAFFLVVDSKAAGGFVDSLSLMDYASGKLTQIKSVQTKVPISPGSALSPARTCVGVPWIGAGVETPRVHAAQLPLRISAHQGLIRIGFSGHGVTAVEVLNARGERFRAVHGKGEGEWIFGNGALPAGVYFVGINRINADPCVRKIFMPR